MPVGIPVSTCEDLSLKIPVGTHWPMGFWLMAPGDLWEKIFMDPGVTKIPMGTDPGHPQVHSCSALDGVPAAVVALQGPKIGSGVLHLIGFTVILIISF